MSTVAILPIKSFGEAKQRLSADFGAMERKALAEAMFSDVLVALRRADAVDDVVVVSADTGAQQIAGGYGAQVLDDDDHGHNPAARRGIRYALEQRSRRTLLVPGDCPLIDPREIDELLARPAAERSALVIPDRHGTGTNALLLAPPDVLAPAFGPGSFARHAARARAAGAAVKACELPSLGLDVDTPGDLAALRAALAARPGHAPRTRALLEHPTFAAA
jgi:2-phospho-L-lactate guanylyltransferase